MDCQSVQCKLEAAVDVGRLPELTALEHQHTQECEHCRTVALLVQSGLPPVVEGAQGSSAPLPGPVSEAEAPEGLAEAVMARIGSLGAAGRGAGLPTAATTGASLEQTRNRTASERVLRALKVFVPLAAAAALILTFMPPQVSTIRTTESPTAETRSKRGLASDQNGFLAPVGKKAALGEDAAPAAAPRQVATDRLREKGKESSSSDVSVEAGPSDDGVDNDEVDGKAFQYEERMKKSATSSLGIAGLRKGGKTERTEEELLAPSQDVPLGGAFSQKRESTLKVAQRPTPEADEPKPEAIAVASLAKELEKARLSPEPLFRGNGKAGARSISSPSARKGGGESRPAPSGPSETKYRDAVDEDAEDARDVGHGAQAPLVRSPQLQEDGGPGKGVPVNGAVSTSSPTSGIGEKAWKEAPVKAKALLDRKPDEQEEKSVTDAEVGRRLADDVSPVQKTEAPSAGVRGTISAVAKPSARAGRAEGEAESESSQLAREGGEAKAVEVARGPFRGKRADKTEETGQAVADLEQAPTSLENLRSASAALVRRYYPRADVELDGNVIRFAFRAEKDTLVRFSKTGKAQQKFARRLAPAKGGIVGQIVFQSGAYARAADNPQTVEGKVSGILLDTASTKKLRGHFVVRLTYPPDVSQEFLKEFRKFLKDIDRHLGE